MSASIEHCAGIDLHKRLFGVRNDCRELLRPIERSAGPYRVIPGAALIIGTAAINCRRSVSRDG
jgi:hypothetical protein